VDLKQIGSPIFVKNATIKNIIKKPTNALKKHALFAGKNRIWDTKNIATLVKIGFQVNVLTAKKNSFTAQNTNAAQK
jgi:hypothetical protein